MSSGEPRLQTGPLHPTPIGLSFERVGTAEDGAHPKLRTSCWLCLACVIVTSGFVLTVAGYAAMTHI
eukprot:6430631-Prymnesium_polylepis.1